MEFHWNWLVAALAELEGPSRTHAVDGAGAPNQEDIDLLVTFGNTAVPVEAKATGSWSNKQIARKLKRLGHLRSAADRLGAGYRIALHFVLTSPAAPCGLSKDHVWRTRDGQFIWMPMHPPATSRLIRVTFSSRTDETGAPIRYWTVR